MVDKALFEYETKRSGHTMTEAAEAMGLTVSGLSRRLNSITEFRASEMEAWMQLTGVSNAGPIFFSSEVACTQPKGGE